jgi:hypothetical protein
MVCHILIQESFIFFSITSISSTFIHKYTHNHKNIQNMAIATDKAHCVICGKDKSSYKCGGCLQVFCFNHLADHKQELSKQFYEIEVNRDLFRQTTDLQKHFNSLSQPGLVG